MPLRHADAVFSVYECTLSPLKHSDLSLSPTPSILATLLATQPSNVAVSKSSLVLQDNVMMYTYRLISHLC